MLILKLPNFHSILYSEKCNWVRTCNRMKSLYCLQSNGLTLCLLNLGRCATRSSVALIACSGFLVSFSAEQENQCFQVHEQAVLVAWMSLGPTPVLSQVTWKSSTAWACPWWVQRGRAELLAPGREGIHVLNST